MRILFLLFLATALPACQVAHADAHQNDGGAFTLDTSNLVLWTAPKKRHCKRGHFATPLTILISYYDDGEWKHVYTDVCPICYIASLRSMALLDK